MQFRNLLLFLALSVIWGASFLWIKIAVRECSPAALGTIRIGLGLSGLLIAMRVLKVRFPREARIWFLFIGAGLLNAAIPFPLVAWAEKHISSSMASVLNGTVPLWTNIVVHFCFPDDKMNARRVAGLLCGFAGVVVLASGRAPVPDGENGHETTLLGVAAMLAAALCYAFANAYTKKFLRGLAPIVISTMTFIFAFLIMLGMWAVSGPLRLPTLPLTWVALSWLGFLGLSAAYVMYFKLFDAWGPSRVSTIAYGFPFTGMMLGIVFLNEAPTWRLLAGAMLIVLGLWIVNRRPRGLVGAETRLIPNPKRSMKWPENLR
jgi:drug/metabolite transporter (DMT)-like permease